MQRPLGIAILTLAVAGLAIGDIVSIATPLADQVLNGATGLLKVLLATRAIVGLTCAWTLWNRLPRARLLFLAWSAVGVSILLYFVFVIAPQAIPGLPLVALVMVALTILPIVGIVFLVDRYLRGSLRIQESVDSR